MRRLLLTICLTVFSSSPVWAIPRSIEVSGIQLPDRIKVEGRNLVLNGAGLRSILLTKAYVAALYLPELRHDPHTILDKDISRSLQLTLLRDISTEQNLDALKVGLVANNSQADLNAISRDVDRFLGFIKKLREVTAGTVIRLDYLPGTGTRVSVNARYVGTIPGKAFNRAVLKIWLGDDPVQTGLKQALLGVD